MKLETTHIIELFFRILESDFILLYILNSVNLLKLIKTIEQSQIKKLKFWESDNFKFLTCSDQT